MKTTLIEADVTLSENNGHFITRKAPIHEEHTILISIYVPNKVFLKFIQKKKIEAEEINMKGIKIMTDLNITLQQRVKEQGR